MRYTISKTADGLWSLNARLSDGQLYSEALFGTPSEACAARLGARLGFTRGWNNGNWRAEDALKEAIEEAVSDE